MDCKEFQNRITPAVDKLLATSEMLSFAEHAHACPECRQEYEAESLTKELVRVKATMVRTPGALMEKVLEQLRREAAAVSQAHRAPLLRLLDLPYAKPVTVLALTSIVVALLFQLRSVRVGTNAPPPHLSGNVIEQSYANYSALQRGALAPQMASSVPEQLQGFFEGKTDFPVLIPELSGFSLAGGVVNHHAGTALAHVVYARGNQMLYMYEACWSTVMQGDKLQVPEHARDELLRTGWFAESRPDGESLVLWTDGNTLCAAVARMEKRELMDRLLNSKHAPTPDQ